MARIDEELKSRFENEQQKAMLNVLFTANWFKNQQVGLFKPYGISPQQYNILRILRGAKDRMNMHCVKERMIDRAPNATRLTDKLIAKGLVERERCEEDRRVVYVRISAKGLELLTAIDEKNRIDQQQVAERLTSTEATELNRLLDTWRG
jgi:DNA-binding MarR family transcriptional regulator